jgi:hypothetical protein
MPLQPITPLLLTPLLLLLLPGEDSEECAICLSPLELLLLLQPTTQLLLLLCEYCDVCHLPQPLLLKLLLLLLPGEDSEECAICLSPLELPCITSCGHVYCRRCGDYIARGAASTWILKMLFLGCA